MIIDILALLFLLVFYSWLLRYAHLYRRNEARTLFQQSMGKLSCMLLVIAVVVTVCKMVTRVYVVLL